jgi:hypothetical protein
VASKLKRNLIVLAIAVLASSFIAGCSGGDAAPAGGKAATGQIDTKAQIHRPKPAVGGGAGGGMPANAQPQ